MTLKIVMVGGTPSQKEKIYSFAEKISQRLFVPTLQPAPLPDHPSGSVVCFSLNYSKVEEDKTSEWSGQESDYEDKPLGLAALIGNIPSDYFSGYSINVFNEKWESDRKWLYSYATDEELSTNRKKPHSSPAKGARK
jgi:hypothetical protein